eukprot:CAMPEP_0177713432 /NCGR_PEP_ID=MMETSP0484_2-20121128/12936_1 /TAXON_ID=354590 /ORGANISM="Rhodomonas lens, Strain RHODO" /LENGTH=650 /DNA_ID=CAMNT_0019225321 /DNA_START=78 /DNA_END=2027 /DNA_ORIENTATION=-
MAVCFSSASLSLRRTAAFCVPSSPLATAPAGAVAWLSSPAAQLRTRWRVFEKVFRTDSKVQEKPASFSCAAESQGRRGMPLLMLRPSHSSSSPAAGLSVFGLPAWPAAHPSPGFATSRHFTQLSAARGGSRGGRGGREPAEGRLLPAERRVLERRRRDGTISSTDLARLSRAERADRVTRGGGAPRGMSQAPPWRRASEGAAPEAFKAAAEAEEEKAPRRVKRARPAWALGEVRRQGSDRDGEEEEEIDEETQGSRNLEPISPLEIVQVQTTAPTGGRLFGGVPCDEKTTAGLAALGIEHPLPIQDVAMTELLTGRSAILHSPTGSGKTMTFLLPLIARLQAGGNGKALRGLVLAPTRELALQIASQIATLQGPRYAFLLVGGTEEVRDQLQQLQQTDAQILVASPDRLLRVLEEEVEEAGLRAKSHVLANCQTVVVDEVDRMLASLSKYATHAEKKKRARHPKPTVLILQRILQHHHLHDLPLQLVACSATVGRPMRKDLAGLDFAFELKELPVIKAHPDPDAMPVEARKQQAAARDFDSGRGPASQGALVPPSIVHRFVSVNRPEDKYAVLQHLLVTVCADKPALLFLNDALSVSKMVGTLKYSGVPRATALHDAMGFGSYDRRNATSGTQPGGGAAEQTEGAGGGEE